MDFGNETFVLQWSPASISSIDCDYDSWEEDWDEELETYVVSGFYGGYLNLESNSEDDLNVHVKIVAMHGGEITVIRDSNETILGGEALKITDLSGSWTPADGMTCGLFFDVTWQQDGRTLHLHYNIHY